MDYIAPTARDFEVDLESGCSVSGDDYSGEETFSGVEKQAKRSIKSEDRVSLGGNVSNSKGVLGKNVMLKESQDEEKKVAKERRKKSTNKKPPRPPKPPRGPSLDSADLKLIKEISELATLKRARIERMKALKKMKAAKQSSSNNMFAMVVTLLFCLVIFQVNVTYNSYLDLALAKGIVQYYLFKLSHEYARMSSREAFLSFKGSPLSAGATEVGLTSVQFSGNPSASYSNGSSPKMVQQVTGSDPQRKPNIAAG